MSIQDSNPLNQLPPHVYQQLQTYQLNRGLETLTAALIEILEHYFGLLHLQSAAAIADPGRTEELERRVNNLTREVVFLRQELSHNSDRLREQLATVRLSHSGLLQNLRDRVETLEQVMSQELSDELKLGEQEPEAI